MSPEEDRTRDAVDSELKHYQLSYSGPRIAGLFGPENFSVFCYLWMKVTTLPDIELVLPLQHGKVEVLRGLRNFLNRDRPEHHSTAHLKERGVERGGDSPSTL